jgi:hypothetical protein
LVQNAKDNDVPDDVAGCGGSALTSKLLEITIALASPLINSAPIARTNQVVTSQTRFKC